jgi:hypothetical protein
MQGVSSSEEQQLDDLAEMSPQLRMPARCLRGASRDARKDLWSARRTKRYHARKLINCNRLRWCSAGAAEAPRGRRGLKVLASLPNSGEAHAKTNAMKTIRSRSQGDCLQVPAFIGCLESLDNHY